MNDLITTAQLMQNLNVILECKLFVDDYIRKEFMSKPIFCYYFNRDRIIKNKWSSYFSKFININLRCDTKLPGIFNFYTTFDNLKIDYPNIKIEKFVELKNESFEINIKNSSIKVIRYDVIYLEIRQELFPYLQQVIDDKNNKYYLRIMKLSKIDTDSGLKYDEYLKVKSKELLNLDLSNYIDDINKDYNEKMKKRFLK